MKLLKQFVCLILMLLSLAGAGLCVAGIIETWQYVGPLRENTNKVFARVESTLGIATRSLDGILVGLKDGKQRLDALQAANPKTAEDVRTINTFERIIAQSLLNRLVPQPGRVQVGLAEVHDASIILQSLLGQVSDLPVGAIASLDLEQTHTISQQLTDVEDRSRELSSLLGQVMATPSDDVDPERVSRTADMVGRLIELVTRYQGELNRIETKVIEVKSKVEFWLRVGPYLVSGLLAWLALAHLSLLAHAWSWFRAAPAK